MVQRDSRGQLAEPWTDEDFELLFILEEVAMDPELTDNPSKTLAAYMADIRELFE